MVWRLAPLAEIINQGRYCFPESENQIVASVVEEDVAFGPENLGLSPREIKKE